MSLRNTALSILILTGPVLLAGCGAAGTPTTTPPNTGARFAFVANSLSNSISSYSVDPQTGRLNPKETVPTGGTSSKVIAVEPSGRFAYVGNTVSNDISVFSIDANTGRLSMMGSPVHAGDAPRFAVVGPTGNIL